jgi:hypothetical protein
VDLVPRQARGADELLGEQVALGERVLVRRRDRAALDLRRQARARLDRQPVGAQVVGPCASAASSDARQSSVLSTGLP